MLKGMAFSPVRVMRVEEESPYKPDTFHLRLKIGTCPHFSPQTISKQNKVPKGRTITWLLSIF